MSPPSFGDRLAEAVDRRGSQVVLGLDPHPPAGADAERAEEVCRRLIERAGAACVGVKIQLACFERHGSRGWAAYERVAAFAAERSLLVIADAKRGDIGLTSDAYAAAFLGGPVDAVTINPMMGSDAVAPFIDAATSAGRGVFCLVRTSNPGAADLQDLVLEDGRPWHEALAERVAAWGAPSVGRSGLSAVGAVVGATAPERLGRLRELMPHQPLLLPGVGAQGGTAEALGPALGAHPAGIVVPASRAIANADDPLAAAEALRDDLRALGS